ncbi:MAG: hypothetical protein ACOVOC_14850 [Rhabdaerophilum sp.]
MPSSPQLPPALRYLRYLRIGLQEISLIIGLLAAIVVAFGASLPK